MMNDEKLDLILSNLEKQDTKFETMERDIKDIKIILENEICVNIQRIAEGYLDISRNIQKIIKHNSEVEMMAIKVGMLETDVRELKQKIS
ncbi:MAG: hypothetical protein IJN54_14865 [Lachnospiraceae bacterium]|nr:hypothetical protein [Lachnospiraceae bacterium]